ncbi:transcriptional regulator, LacI family [Coriobacterium glomerans PW2]|uniref:Transcriptional regulator, LacI family n=1 Tax=Coriobacterium glomerans (strain ATCC 49209 / DSM 20642 / JCM 10262 / PW2) TaxID=700015 RepID=F2NAX4_CORGP|nr:LacI family DNA-binding transcriptional regulator [Coriobacterium glomerans]AEB07652.1 transcriptional regulator, LacI family [Coriobacterium glomerans PW2]
MTRASMKSCTTIKDIAAKVGMSVTAVSLVLNEKPCRITDENRKRIKEAAHELNYSPNYSARSLKTQQTMTLGLIVPNIASHFYSKIAKNLEEECRELGYALFITGSKNRSEDDCRLLNMLARRGIDGLFFVSSSEAVGDSEVGRQLCDLHVPYVLVGRYLPAIECDSIRFDEEAGAHRATCCLIERGHTKIGCIVNTVTSESGALRYDGYRRALAEAGIASNPEYCAESDYDIGESYKAMEKLIRTDISAVLATSDSIALGAVRCIQDHNRRIPDDISVVGFDEEIAYQIYKPRLTIIKRDIEHLCHRATAMLHDRIENTNKDLQVEFNDEAIMPELLEGESVKTLTE